MPKKNNLGKSAKSLTICKKSNCNNISKNDQLKTGKCIIKNCNKQLKEFQKDFSNSLRLIADEMNQNRSPKNKSQKKKSSRKGKGKRKGKGRGRGKGRTSGSRKSGK